MKFRIAALFALLIAILLLSGTSPLSASPGARISAHLTSTSFAATKASKVKLIYSFSSTSRRFSYLLTRKVGAKWQSVKQVKKIGSFSGRHTMTVKRVFAGKAIKVGKYHLRLAADVGSKTLSFTVKKASGGGGVPPPPTPPQKPAAFSKTSPSTGATGQVTTPLLSWTASTEATSYSYCIDTTNNNACDGSWIPSPTTSASLSGLALSATYYWQVRAINAQGTTDADSGSWSSFTVSGPTAGYWESTGFSGPSGNGLGSVTAKSVFFNVGADSSTVSGLGFTYSYQDYYCSGDDGRSWLESPSSLPITSGQFTDPSGMQVWGEQTGSLATGTGDFSGTFDSPTTAHGTAKLWITIQCGGPIHFQNVVLGPFSWTAAWKSAS